MWAHEAVLIAGSAGKKAASGRSEVMIASRHTVPATASERAQRCAGMGFAMGCMLSLPPSKVPGHRGDAKDMRALRNFLVRPPPPCVRIVPRPYSHHLPSPMRLARSMRIFQHLPRHRRSRR